MVKYSCERCGKEFSQKSHFDSHNKRKTACENNTDKIKQLVDNVVEEKLKKLNNTKVIIENNNSIKQTTGLNRQILDKYYTSDDAVTKCIELIQKHITIRNDDLCIEPSAGDGSFINGIKSLFTNYKFYDIEPEHSEIIKQDYLTFDYDNMIELSINKKHVIGNPPFGRQSSLAIKFIKKSVEYCDSISFILPKSFKKDSLKKYFPLNFYLECEYDLPEYSFTINDDSYNVPCVFQIWIKKNVYKSIPTKLIPHKYKFVKKTLEHDISFRRVGVYAGEICKDTELKSIQSHYFIKFDNILTDELFNQLSQINYNCKNNTVGPKSISKQELIKEFNTILV